MQVGEIAAMAAVTDPTPVFRKDDDPLALLETPSVSRGSPKTAVSRKLFGHPITKSVKIHEKRYD